MQTAERNHCDGLTVSGGDPFEQPKALHRLLSLVRDGFSDILVYTGYTLEEIRKGISGAEGINALTLIDVLIDGKYVEELNQPDVLLRGSANQVIHYLNLEMRNRYTEYMKRGRIAETFIHNDTVIITGILNRGI